MIVMGLLPLCKFTLESSSQANHKMAASSAVLTVSMSKVAFCWTPLCARRAELHVKVRHSRVLSATGVCTKI